MGKLNTHTMAYFIIFLVMFSCAQESVEISKFSKEKPNYNVKVMNILVIQVNDLTYCIG